MFQPNHFKKFGNSLTELNRCYKGTGSVQRLLREKGYVMSFSSFIRHFKALLPYGQCAQLRIERFGFESWLGILCCVLGHDTLLSQCLSLPRCINRYGKFNAGVTLRWTSIPSREEYKYCQSLPVTKTEDHKARHD